MSPENLLIRRGRLMHAMTKAVDKCQAATARYQECAAEIAEIDELLPAEIEKARAALPTELPAPPKFGDVMIGVPTAQLGAKSEG